MNCTVKLADPDKSTVVTYDNNDFSSIRSELSQYGGQGTGGLLTCLVKAVLLVRPLTNLVEIVDLNAVSYTHLTLPTKRIV